MTAARNLKRRIRERARRHITALLIAEGHRCHWCGEPIIDPVTIPEAALVALSGDWVTWWSGRKTASRRVATVDHVLPLALGGRNDLANLVASCAPCNRERTKTRSPFPMEERWKCRDCGGRKDDYHRRRCFACRNRSDPRAVV